MSVVAPANLATGGKATPALVERWGLAIPSVDQSSRMMLLPTVLSLIAGSCDIITFIGLGGLFTAHITGNLVVLIARVVAGEHAPISYILLVPMFVAALAVTTLSAALLGRAGIASLRPLLILQLLLLSACFLICVAADARIHPTDGKALIAGMLAVFAMAVQNAIVQVSVAGMPSTAVMTTNVSGFVVGLDSGPDRAQSGFGRKGGCARKVHRIGDYWLCGRLRFGRWLRNYRRAVGLGAPHRFGVRCGRNRAGSKLDERP